LHQIKRSRRLEYRCRLPDVVCEPQESWDYSYMLNTISEAVSRLSANDQALTPIPKLSPKKPG